MVAQIPQQLQQPEALFTRTRVQPLPEGELDGLDRELARTPDVVLVEAAQLRSLVRTARRVRQLEAEAEIQSWRVKLEAQELALQLLRDL